MPPDLRSRGHKNLNIFVISQKFTQMCLHVSDQDYKKVNVLIGNFFQQLHPKLKQK